MRSRRPNKASACRCRNCDRRRLARCPNPLNALAGLVITGVPSRMTTTPSSPGAPITDRRQLIEHLESGSKPPSAWRVGTEHEKFVFRRSDLRRVPYEGPDGIGALLGEMTRFGWKRVVENGNTIALTDDARCSITLEPGGQFELSGAPLETVHQT